MCVYMMYKYVYILQSKVYITKVFHGMKCENYYCIVVVISTVLYKSHSVVVGVICL